MKVVGFLKPLLPHRPVLSDIRVLAWSESTALAVHEGPVLGFSEWVEELRVRHTSHQSSEQLLTSFHIALKFAFVTGEWPIAFLN